MAFRFRIFLISFEKSDNIDLAIKDFYNSKQKPRKEKYKIFRRGHNYDQYTMDNLLN